MKKLYFYERKTNHFNALFVFFFTDSTYFINLQHNNYVKHKKLINGSADDVQIN